MATIEVQRQLLPILDSPNQGARFYNPELPSTEPFVPGHRTCAGCGPSIQYRMTSKASGDNTILVGPTGCMYVANSSYLCTPYNVPWAHTQIGSAGSFTAGVAAAYEAMIRKGKYKRTFPKVTCESGDVFARSFASPRTAAPRTSASPPSLERSIAITIA